MRQSQRQTAIDRLRSQPEFAAFQEIEAVAAPCGDALLPGQGEILLGDAAFRTPCRLGFFLRLGLELVWLRRRGTGSGLAALAAARAAALFIAAELDGREAAERDSLPPWVGAMAGDVAPAAEPLLRVAAALGEAPSAAEIAQIRAIWNRLGTAEALMETGGDIRLQRDPRSALNGYGCSHRPRPWAITFASSTASSCSERGYLAADLERLRTTAALLADAGAAPVAASLAAVRRGIAESLGLPPAVAVVLAASGTDTELLALALSHLAEGDRPIRNILVAQEETGRGVPMAARGLHFAVDTALGHAVCREAPIAGFRPDTELANVALRDAAGGLRGIAAVESELAELVKTGLAAGKRVILHALDLSKTGLLAPRPGFLARLRGRHGDRFDIVVDACQARLSGGSIARYLALDAVVLLTGSKFFTGPPFAGALLLPEAVARRLSQASLPVGLDAYFGRDEFPPGGAAAARLPPCGNYGLALRWHAALAEMRAFAATPAGRRAEILQGFGSVVGAAIAADPALRLLPAPPIRREADEACENEAWEDEAWEDEAWERLPSLLTFSLQAPQEPARCLTPAEARSVYLWLNADLSGVIGDHPAAKRICHIGQPVRLPQPSGEGLMGVLRVSAGARLIAGEPAHRGLPPDLRIEREFADLRTVFDKIALILRHWQKLQAADPQPRYRPAELREGALADRAARPHLAGIGDALLDQQEVNPFRRV